MEMNCPIVVTLGKHEGEIYTVWLLALAENFLIIELGLMYERCYHAAAIV